MRLRPGVPVLTYDDHYLQVGVEIGLKVLVPNRPEIRDLLDTLRTGQPTRLTSHLAEATLARLVDADLVVEEWSAAGPHELGLLAAYGSVASDIDQRRSTATVGVEAPSQFGQALAARVAAAGLKLGEQPDVVVIADRRRAPADRIDSLMRGAIPHLVVSGGPLGWVVGPFVIPGRTACVRCVDLHLSGGDPRFGHLMAQVDTHRWHVPEPDLPLQDLAWSWAVRDLLLYVDDDEPTTLSATYAFSRRGLPARREWTAHPHCGCGWDHLGDDVEDAEPAPRLTSLP